MRASIILASVFVAGVLSSPVFETKNVYVWKTVVITEGSLPTPTPEPVVQPVDEAPRKFTWYNGRRRHRFSWVFNPASVTPQVTSAEEEEPEETSTSSSKAPPPPSSTPPPPPPPSSTPPPPPPPSSSTPPPPPPPSSTPPPPSSTPPPPAPTPKPQPAPESDGSPLSGGVSLLTTANKWRSIYSLSKFVWDSQLAKNALKTGVDGGGVNQVHQLGPGSYGQVITPGMRTAFGDLGGDSPFELSYVAWLCEVSSDSELKTGGVDQCALVEDNLHMQYSSTGHYDILTSKSYSKIGCAFAPNPNAGTNTPYQGLWVCDLGF